MNLRAAPFVVRSLRAARNWLKHVWLGSLSIFDRVRGLFPRCNRAAAWDNSGKPLKVSLALEGLEKRVTPLDVFGLLHAPILGSGLALLGAQMQTPATVLMNGWSAGRPPIPSPRPTALEGRSAPGLFGRPAAPAEGTSHAGAQHVPAAAGAGSSGPIVVAAAASDAKASPDDPFADPLGGDWLDDVGRSLALPPSAAVAPGGGVGAAAPSSSSSSPAAGALPAAAGAAFAADDAPADPGLTNVPTAASIVAPAHAAGASSSAPVPSGSSGAPLDAPAGDAGDGGGGGNAGTAASALQAYGRTELAFEPNLGQTNSQVQYVAHGSGFQTFLTAGGAVLSLTTPAQGDQPATSSALEIAFDGGNPDPQTLPSGQLPSRSDYYIGSDASQWLYDVPNYSTVAYDDVYPGVNVQFQGDSQRELEYDFLVAPGADLSQIKLSFNGAAAVSTDQQGDLLIQTNSGQTLTQTAPVLYQTVQGARQAVAGGYVLNGDGTVGFQAQDYDPSQTLVIDPTLSYSSYLGGSGDDKAYSVAVAPDGSAYVVGATESLDFPTSPGAFGTTAYATTTYDAFVTRMMPSGSGVIYSTYLGGSANNEAHAVAVDLGGDAVVGGTTGSSDFPTTGDAYQTSAVIGGAFVAKLNLSGDALLYSTYLGPATGDAAAVAVDRYGDAFLTGSFVSGGNSTTFPYAASTFPTTAGAFQTSPGGGGSMYTDAFVAELNPAGTGLIYSSDLGGSNYDYGTGIAVDSSGDAFVTGYTASGNFPTTAGAYQTSLGSASYDAFLTEVNPAGSALEFSTYFGGTTGESEAYALTLDDAGAPYLTGFTTSSNFPTTSGAYQSSDPTTSGESAFVSKFSASGALVYSTYLGGAAGDSQGYGVAPYPSGDLVVTGSTTSSAFPTTSGAYQTSAGGGTDAFVAVMTSTGGLTYSTYLGGSGTDVARGVAVDLDDYAYVAGYTNSTNFPTAPGAFQSSGHSTISYDAFVTKLMPSLSVPPPPPVFTGINPDTGSFSTDQVTDTGNFTIEGTAVANATVTLSEENVGVIDTVVAGSSGLWTSTYYSSAHTLSAGTAAFTATQTAGGVTGASTTDWLVTVETTPPNVTLVAPASTTSLQPTVTVLASDLDGLASPAAVTLLVYNSTGTTLLYTDSSAATTSNGAATFAVPNVLTPGTTYQLKVQVANLAGDTGTSSGQTVTINTATGWTLAGSYVLTSDPVDGDAADQLGNVSVSHALNLDQSGGGQSGGAALVFNSDTVDVEPTIETTIDTPNNVPLPPSFTAVLDWDGVVPPVTYTYATTGTIAYGPLPTPGAPMSFNAQWPHDLTATGRHTWTLSITASGEPTLTSSGDAMIVNLERSPYGPGWSFGGTDQLITIPASGGYPAGVLRVFGTGGWRFYASAGGGAYTSPGNDFGTLAAAGGGFTYTTPDGQVETFDGSGDETQWTSADGHETIQYRYSGGALTGMTAIDGALSTFSYSGVLLSTIQTVNNRTTTVLHDPTTNDLTAVINPDGGLDGFGYDMNQRVVAETFGGLQNEWAYGLNGALELAEWGDSGVAGTTTMVPVVSGALMTAVRDTVLATAYMPNQNTTTYQLDYQGRPLVQYDSNGGTVVWTRDTTTSQVLEQTDPLGRTTQYSYDSSGYTTQEILPDGTTVSYAYQSAFHALTSQTDALGGVTSYAYDSGGHLTSTTDALGDVTGYGYNGSGLETSMTDPLGNVTDYAYDADRRMTATTDPLGGVETLTYDANGFVLTTTDALGHLTTTLYDAMGDVTSTTDPLGNVSSETYDASGEPLLAENALLQGTKWFYDVSNRGLVNEVSPGWGTTAAGGTYESFDGAGNPTLSWDADGGMTTMLYDSMGRLTATVNPQGAVALSEYDLGGEMIASRNELGLWTTYGYNSVGEQTSQTDPLTGVTQTAYDAAGDVTSTTDPLGHTTTTKYNLLGEATASTDGAGNTVTTTYDAAGDVSTVTNPNGSVASYAYDADGRQTMTTVAVGTALQATSTMAYDKAGNMTSSTDALGHVSSYKYDADGQQTTATDPLGHTVTTAYDVAGEATAVTDGTGRTTDYGFDGQDRQVSTTDPLGDNSYVVLSPDGQQRASVDGLGHVTQTVYDLAGRATAVVDALYHVTRTLYNAADETTAVVDADGNKTQFFYDALGRPTLTIDPLGNRTTTTYDAASNVSTVTDADGHEQVFHYDGDERVTASTWLSSAGATVNLLTYTYDADGNQLTAADCSGTYTNSYDALDRLTAQTDPLGLTLTYLYDNAGDVTQRADSLGGVLTYVYDNASRLTSEQFGGTGMTQARVDLAYANNDALATLTRYSDVAGSTLVGTTGYGYDLAGRVTAITNKNASAATLSYYDYTYDAADRVSTESWQSTTATGTLSGAYTYSYDFTNQLLSDGTTSYSYDATGNRTMSGYQTGTDNRISTDGTWTYTYDNVGDMIEKSKGSGLETWYYGYDTLNRLTSVEQTSNGTTAEMTATYTYDVYDNLKEVDEWQSGGATTVTRYAYDGGEEWAELNGSNTLQVRDLYAVGYIAARTVSSGLPNAGLSWYFVDNLGSTTDIFSASSPTYVLNHATYDAFGKETDTSASVADQHGYAGGFTDRLAQFDHFGMRWYNPATGTWTSPDPEGFGAGDANIGRYVGNDPTNATDPSGLVLTYDGAMIAQIAWPQGNNFLRVVAQSREFDAVSRQEWEGAGLRDFDLYDQNGDGYVTISEAICVQVEKVNLLVGAINGEFDEPGRDDYPYEPPLPDDPQHIEAPPAVQGPNPTQHMEDLIQQVEEGDRNFVQAAETIGVAAPVLQLGLDLGAGGAQSLAPRMAAEGSLIGDAAELLELKDTLCFTRVTPVLTGSGLKAIADIDAGEFVKGFDFASGRWCLAEVLARHDNIYSGPLVIVHIGASRIEATFNHPFWVVEGRDLQKRSAPAELSRGEDEGRVLQGRWVYSQELQSGDWLQGEDGKRRRVKLVEQRLEASIGVSNLTVKGCHTFAVGAAAVLVHNVAWCEYLTKLKGGYRSLKQLVKAAGDNDVEIHAHHIVMKTITSDARGPFIKTAQEILKKHDIDVLFSRSNLTWALNWDHSVEYAQAVAETLVRADANGGKEAVVEALDEIAKILNRGEKFRGLP